MPPSTTLPRNDGVIHHRDTATILPRPTLPTLISPALPPPASRAFGLRTAASPRLPSSPPASSLSPAAARRRLVPGWLARKFQSYRRPWAPSASSSTAARCGPGRSQPPSARMGPSRCASRSPLPPTATTSRPPGRTRPTTQSPGPLGESWLRPQSRRTARPAWQRLQRASFGPRYQGVWAIFGRERRGPGRGWGRRRGGWTCTGRSTCTPAANTPPPPPPVAPASRCAPVKCGCRFWGKRHDEDIFSVIFGDKPGGPDHDHNLSLARSLSRARARFRSLARSLLFRRPPSSSIPP